MSAGAGAGAERIEGEPEAAAGAAARTTVGRVLTAGTGLAPVLLRRAATVELDWDTRQRSRFACRDSAGRDLHVFLPRGRPVRGGDVLVADDGSLVRVVAADETVMVVTPRAGRADPALDLMRAAYHLGNRHVALDVRADRLQLAPDTVLADMLRGLGVDVHETRAAFEPEGGAYGAHAGHSGHAAHGHEREHGHGHHQGHDPDHGHVHDEHCGHRHG